MIKIVKPRYKKCFQLNESIFNDLKFIKLKRKKWDKIRLRISGKNKIVRRLNVRSNQNNLVSGQRRVYLRNLYKSILNLKRKIVSFYGPMKKQFIYRFLLSTLNRSTNLKGRDGNLNRISSNLSEYNRKEFVVIKFESMLGITLLRSNFVKSIYMSFFLISCGHILINNKVCTNPRYILNVGDVITVKNPENLKKILNCYFKRTAAGTSEILSTSNLVFKAKHLLVDFKAFSIVYLEVPKFNDLEFVGFFDWDLIFFLTKLKRL